jgi:PAS domain S-box-containing protein
MRGVGAATIASEARARDCLRALSRSVGADEDEPEAVLRSLALSPEAMVLVDGQRRIVFSNDVATQLTGYAEDELVGRTCVDALNFVTCGQRCVLFEDGRICGRPCLMRKRDGSDLNIIKNARALFDAPGRVVGGLETLQDLGELLPRQAPAAGRASDGGPESALRALVGCLDEALLTTDGAARVTSVSAAAAALLGAEPTALLGRPLIDVLGGHARLRRCLAAALGQGKTVACPALPIGPRGDQGVALRLTGMLAPSGHPFGLAVTLYPEATPHAEAFYGIVAESQAMRELLATVGRLAQRDAAVLITGESGVGKEIVARALHEAGPRRAHPFHAVNCAALTATLLESELFGHERGAFTGAVERKPGRLELAGAGTLLLDEVGCLPLGLQAKLLRVLEQRQFERVGGTQTLTLRGRVLAATNSDLGELVARGAFRADLYYRLKVVPLDVPPLRQRPRDVLALARHFARELGEGGAGSGATLAPDAEGALLRYPWPGNVRELRNAVLHALTLGDGRRVRLRDLPREVQLQAALRGEVGPRAEEAAIRDALVRTRYNRAEAADLLGISRTTLWRRTRKLGMA